MPFLAFHLVCDQSAISFGDARAHWDERDEPTPSGADVAQVADGAVELSDHYAGDRLSLLPLRVGFVAELRLLHGFGGASTLSPAPISSSGCQRGRDPDQSGLLPERSVCHGFTLSTRCTACKPIHDVCAAEMSTSTSAPAGSRCRTSGSGKAMRRRAADECPQPTYAVVAILRARDGLLSPTAPHKDGGTGQPPGSQRVAGIGPGLHPRVAPEPRPAPSHLRDEP